MLMQNCRQGRQHADPSSKTLPLPFQEHCAAETASRAQAEVADRRWITLFPVSKMAPMCLSVVNHSILSRILSQLLITRANNTTTNNSQAAKTSFISGIGIFTSPTWYGGQSAQGCPNSSEVFLKHEIPEDIKVFCFDMSQSKRDLWCLIRVALPSAHFSICPYSALKQVHPSALPSSCPVFP